MGGEIAVVRENAMVREVAMVEKIAVGAYGVVVARCCDQVGSFASGVSWWCLLVVSPGGGHTHYTPSSLLFPIPRPLCPLVPHNPLFSLCPS